MRPMLSNLLAPLLGVYVATMLLFCAADASGQDAAPGPVGDAILANQPHGPPCIDRDGPGPAPCIADPLTAPIGESIDTADAARRLGWAMLALVVIFAAVRIASIRVAWLRVGWRALAVSSLLAAIAAAVNAGFLGGTWWSMVAAGGAAGLMAMQGKGSDGAVA